VVKKKQEKATMQLLTRIVRDIETVMLIVRRNYVHVDVDVDENKYSQIDAEKRGDVK
jgi:hypothetical protein